MSRCLTSVTYTQVTIPNLQLGEYTARISAKNIFGQRSLLVAVQFSVLTPTLPTVYVTADYNQITLTADIATAGIGTAFEWEFLGTTESPQSGERVLAQIYNRIGLKSETEYKFRVRSVNHLGASAWVDVIASTTLVDLTEFINGVELTQLSPAAQALIDDMNTQVDRLRPETAGNLPSLIIKNIDAITGINSKVEVIDADNPNSIQSQLAESNSQIASLNRATEVLNPESPTGLPAAIKINQASIAQQRTDQEELALSVISVAADYTSWRTEYERRALKGEVLIDAAVYIDPKSGKITNRAFAYTDQSFNSATLRIDGVVSKIELTAKELTSTQKRMASAEAELVVQAGKISQRATFSEVESQIAGALEALQPAYSWQFNSGSEGFNADSHNPDGFIVTTKQLTSPALSYNAQENPIIRLRVRKHASTTWLGDINFNGSTAPLHLPEPTGTEWETVSIDATGATGYAGTITGLEFNLGTCDIDFIEIGKRSANDLALKDITARTSTLEVELNAVNGTITQLAKTSWVEDQGYQTQSDVSTKIDSFNTTYNVSAILQEITDNNIIVKANAAQTWVDGAEATITNQVSSILNSENGVTERIGVAEQTLDAIGGEIAQTITQVSGLEIDAKDKSINDILTAYNQMILSGDLAAQGAGLASAQEKLSAVNSELESVAKQSVDLAVAFNKNTALFNGLNVAFANERTASSKTEQNLRAEIKREGTQSVAAANERLEAVVGYCVNASGERVDQVDATQCELDGNTWIDGPLVERVNNYTAVFVDGKGYQTANNVQEYVNTFDAEHGITAIIQQINDEGIITAAKEAQQWINASEGTITNMITQFVNKPDGINSNLAFAYDLIQANADENQVTATAQEQIALRLGTTELDLKNVSDGLATEAQARATQGSEIRLEFKSQDAAMLATAKDYTRAVTGYCVNDLGERVDQDDAALCIAGGNNWIDGPAVSRAIELSAAYVDGKGYQTQSDVTQSLNTFDNTYSVSATLQAFSANNTIKKANAAQQFINGAESYIESRIVDFNAADNGVDSKFSDVVQRLDAAEGVARTSISQITGIELDLKDKTFDDIVSEYSKFATTTDLTKVDVKASFADEKLKAQTTELESIAEQSVNLAALFNKNAALINSVTRAVANDEKASVIRDERYKAKFEESTARFSDVTTAIAKIDEANVIRDQEMASFVFETVSSFDEVAQTFASQEQAYTTLGQTLTTKIGNDTLEAKNAAIATAQQYTRTAVGYCVNAQGQISNESDAVACVAAGGSWVAGPLAEFIENLQISEGGKTASIKQMRQVFKTVDGELVARGGWQLDNNGRAVGVVGYNDGQIGNLDLVGDVIRQGAMVGNTFVPTSYVDNTDPAKPLHVIRGRLELGDGHVVTSLDDIKAQDGKPGERGSDAYTNLTRSAEEWVVGTSGTQGSFYKNGLDSHNVIISSEGPEGVIEHVWKSEGVEPSTGASGGWGKDIQVDPNKTYRYSVWMKEDSNEQHNVYLGCADVKNLDNTYNSNPYFYVGNLPTKNKWYLVIGYLHSASKTDSTPSGMTGVYDPETGTRIYTGTEFKQNSGQTAQKQRVFRFYAKNDAAAYFTRPRVEEVNGEEMSLGALMGRIPKDGKSPTITTNPDGSYTITSDGSSIIIKDGLDGDDAPIPTVTNNGNGTHTVTDGAGNSVIIKDGAKGYTPIKGTDYFDGNDGSFVSFIYHATTNTNLAAPTGGTFNGTTETIPTNWQDAPYFVDGRVTYVSKARYVNNGTSWARGAWSKPSPYIIKGDKGSKGDTVKGDPGNDGKRGAERETVATASGVWYDSVAKAAMPDGVAVLNDIVTIYKSGDPSVETTKRFNGSSWQSYTLRVHGSALIEDTLDGKVLRAGTRIESPRIDLIGNNFMKIELASGFGPENLWYWFGPKLMKNGLPDLDNLTRANATEWKDINGNSFTKGTFISGALESSVSTGHLVNNPSREIEFTSNGNLIHFAVSYSHRRTKEGPTDGDRASVLCPAQGFTPTSGTFYLERWIGNAWYVVHSRTFSGTYSCRNGEYEEEGEGSNMKTPNVAYYSTSISGGTFTFSQTPGSGYQRYRVRAQVNNFYAVSGVAQYLSLAVSEA